MEIPVYLFTGFLESGKTSFINDTLNDKDFIDGGRTLVIACEEGMEEYDEVELGKREISVLYIEEEEQLTEEYLKETERLYRPDRIFVEFNGLWNVSNFIEQFPENWSMVQVISTINATTFDMYLNNMKGMILEQIKYSDLVIFNRCDENSKTNSYRRAIKATNRKAVVGFEGKDGQPLEVEEELPYDLSKDEIVLEDYDYGIWYLDAMEHPKKYEGKTIKMKAVVYKGKKLAPGEFVPGRFAMTCCADDITFIGFVCKYDKASELPLRAWVDVTAQVRCEYRKEYKGKGPVLYAKSVTAAAKPKEDLVYFN